MEEILLLNKDTIDKIAAGEVAERPAAVVKELVENALDAGASRISVETRNGGSSLIRVTDDGCGIPAGQVRTAFLRHATSKIHRAEDLETVVSLGFRGEALASIAAVSRVECITRTRDSLAGIRYRIEGGEEQECSEIGAPEGTTLLVRDLFYQTPARAKFLKTPALENRAVRETLEELALSHPSCAFTCTADGRTVLVTSGSGSVPEIVYQIYGRETANGLIPFESGTEDVHASGYLGTASVARGNRSCERFFVNGRCVSSDLLTGAVEEAYRGLLMQHRYPFVLLYLRIDGSKVDVNVHPAKREVRFSDREGLFRLLSDAVRQTLRDAARVPVVTADRKERPAAPVLPKAQDLPEPFEKDVRKTAGAVREPSVSWPRTERRPQQATFLPEDRFLSAEARKQHRLVGQVFGTYWLLEYRDSLYIMDQHAAHEKVLFERLMKRYRERSVLSQNIWPAVVIEAGTADAGLLRERLDVFASLGFEIEGFGGEAFKISALPADLFRTDPKELFRDILDQMRVSGDIPAASLTERLASMSCKAAVKGNTAQSFAEADALLDELLLLEDPYHCPHGRPTLISMTREELDRKFKRIL